MEKTLYACPVCSMQYRDKATANECEAWCTKHQSCNLDIIAKAVNKKGE